MADKITVDKVIRAFLDASFMRSEGNTSLADIASILHIKKASLYNHFESREIMYEKTMNYCKRSLGGIAFLPEKYITPDLFENNSIFEVFNNLIKRFIQFYEDEPFFQIYTFIHSEQYYNKDAASIVDDEIFRIELGVSQILLRYCVEKKLELTPGEIDSGVKFYASALMQQIDSYIMHKKEIVRQNPECGAGSLFALPTDEEALNKIYSLSENFLNQLVK